MMNKKHHILITVLSILIFAAFSPLHAKEYYVDQNHPDASDQNAGTLSQPWVTITKANQTLTAGDIVYIRTGTYNSYIAPGNSGTPSNRIIYRNYGNDIVTISDTTRGILLDGNSYITIQGIDFYNLDQFLYIQNNSNYNIIAYCDFDQGRNIDWHGSRIFKNSTNNWIHHCRFSNYGYYTNDDIGSILDIGSEEDIADHTYYNVIENSTFYHGGHHVLGIFSNYNVLRKNFMHNEKWYEYQGTEYGNRVLYISGYRDYTKLNLIEGNRIGYAGVPSDGDSSYALQLSASYNIVRHNDFYKGTATGIMLSATSSYPDAPSHNRIYNNTFWDNGTEGIGGEKESGVGLADWGVSGTIEGNVFVNNLFYQNGSPATAFGYYGVDSRDQVFVGNWKEAGDPKFTNISSSDPMSLSKPDFTLQSNSPVINAGKNLTIVSRIIDSDTIIVADAYFFQPGTWAAPVVGLKADEICIGNVNNCVTISSIEYSTNTLNTVSPHGAQVDDEVWLHKDSSGTVIMVETAPDIGAHEYGYNESTAPLAPANFRFME